MSGFRRRLGGFTLVELMVTIAVIAILATIAAPNMMAFLDRNRVVGAGEAVYGQLQAARSEAIKQGARMTAAFSSGSAWCVGYARGDVACDCTAALGGSNPCSILGDGQNALLTAISSGPFSGVGMNAGGPASLTFDGVRGTLTGAGGGVSFSSAQGRQLRVEVNVLGRVRLCSPDGSVGGYPTCN